MDTERICNALLGIVFCEPDWQWAQNIFLELLENGHPDIKGLSATCLGHIARIHGKLDKAKVISALKKYLHDPRLHIRGNALDALQDIEQFLK